MNEQEKQEAFPWHKSRGGDKEEMNKAIAIILIIAIVTLCGFCMAYGADFYGFRGAANHFFLEVAGPAIYSTLSGIAVTIAANQWYQLLHPILWMVAGGVLVGIAWKALKPHMPTQLGGPKTVATQKTMTMQKEPAEPEPPQKTEKPIQQSSEQ
jgi:hypothetical protein